MRSETQIWEKCADSGFSPEAFELSPSPFPKAVWWCPKLTEMVRQNRVTDTDVPCDTFIEATVCKYAESSSKVLFAVQPFFFKRPKFWIGPNFQSLARLCLSEGLVVIVVGVGVVEDSQSWCHD